MARKAKISTNAFLAAYLKAHAEGKTNAQFAASFGMDAKTASVKASSIRSQLAKKNKVLPHLAKESGGNPELDALIAQLDNVTEDVAGDDTDTLDAVDGDVAE